MDIKIVNAHENNLKNIDVSIPKNKLIAFTGVSGSGKSTLALDTIQRECQRLYMESLGMMLNVGTKAKVDSIQGLSPAISITQHQSNNNPRSSVGTITEVTTYLRILFSKLGAVNTANNVLQELTANHFSYNSPQGACKNCNGIGEINSVAIDTLIDMKKSIKDFAIYGWDQAYIDRYGASLLASAKHYGFSLDIAVPIQTYNEIQMDLLLYGVLSEQFSSHFQGVIAPKTVPTGRFEGVVTSLLRRYSEQNISPTQKKRLEKFFTKKECPVCKGNKWNPEILDIYVNQENIQTVLEKSISEAFDWILQLQETLKEKDLLVATFLIDSITEKLEGLIDVGVEYLTLEQPASTLSSGEWQRIKLASVINNGLTGVLYILDEPSSGLHYSDIDKVIGVLRKLRDLGNTVIVIEHNLKIIKAVDYIIDFGPEAGKNGGEIIVQGNQEMIEQSANSLTGKYLLHSTNTLNAERRETKHYLSVSNATINNLKNIDINIPLHSFVTVTGVSGSGKTSLVFDVIANQAELFFKREFQNGNVKGFGNIKNVVVINHNSVGRSSRSNIATYTDLFNDIRKIYADLSSGFSMKDFSTNTVGGRCEECQGSGILNVPMHFLPDVQITCPTCNGKRYIDKILEVKYKGYDISEILSMDINQAITVFSNHKKVMEKLTVLQEIGLGYLGVGQSTATLSGGEAQRLKLAKELMVQGRTNQLYLFDEPTTGLHQHDVIKVINILKRIVEQGNSVIVIEHNLSVICQSDYVIDMGLHGGKNGGTIIVTGTPYQIAQSKKGITACVLEELHGEADNVVIL